MVFPVFAVAAAILTAVCYFIGFSVKSGNKAKYYVIPKCAGSLICVFLGILALLLQGRPVFSNLLIWTLLLCMAGDYFIEYKLMAGGLSFGAAHCLLMVYSLLQAPFHPYSILIWAAGFIFVCLLFKKDFPAMGKLITPFILYVLLLVGDFAIAAALPFTVNSGYLPLAAGLLSFVASDLMLGKRQFGHGGLLHSKLVMLFYYMALYLMAISLWFIG